MYQKLIEQISSIAYGEAKTYPKGETICSPGDKDRVGYLIKSGHVKVYDIDQNGDIKAIIYLTEGEVFPLIWAFDHPSEIVYYYKTLDDVELVKFPLPEFKTTLSNDKELSRAAQMMFVYISWDLIERVKCLQMNLTYDRLLRTLPYLAVNAGTKVKSGIYELKKFVTHEEISHLIGTTRESVTANIQTAKKNGIVVNSNGQMRINIDKIPGKYIYDVWFKEQT